MKVRPTSRRRIRDTQLIKVIKEIQSRIYSAYGYCKMWRALVVWDWDVSRDRVADLMRTAALKRVIHRGKPLTTRSAPRSDHRLDMVHRNFSTGAPNKVGVTDFTYVRICAGFAYITFITTVYSRKIVGWEVSTSTDTDKLPLPALITTGAHRVKGGLIHHIGYSSRSYP